jgi:uncharacterized phage-like protein YoqJ
MEKDIRMTIAITGHRPQSIDGDFTCSSPDWQWIRQNLTETFTKVNPKRVITGMALGVDTVAAEVALAMQIPYVAAIPFPGQELKWNKEAQDHYHTLLAWAEDVVTVDKGPYHPMLMDKRNKYMVDNADLVVAVWNGWKGGTRNCVEYALRQQVPVWRLDPKTRKIGRYDGTQHIVKELVGGQTL